MAKKTRQTKRANRSNRRSGGGGGGGMPAMQTVPVTDPAAVMASGASGTRGGGRAIVDTNIAGGRASSQAGAIDLQTGGVINPLVQQQIDSTIRSDTRAGSKLIAANEKLAKQISQLETKLANTRLNPRQREKFQSDLDKFIQQRDANTVRIEELTQNISDAPTRVAGDTPSLATTLQDTLAPTYQQLDIARTQLGQQGTPGVIGQRFMDQMGQGYQAGNIRFDGANASQSARTQLGAAPTMRAADARFVSGPQAAMAQRVADVRSQSINAPQMGNFGAARSQNISAGTVGQGALGAALMNRAMQGVQSGGRLSAEASRDATQAARQGLAARGMATGGIGMASELLNRDRYRREREMQDLQFAAGAQQQDVQRQLQNVGNQLSAAQSNQSAAMQAELANLQARYNAAVQAGDWQLAAATQNQDANLRAQMANQGTATSLSIADQSAINQMREAGYRGNIEQNLAAAMREQQARANNQQMLGEFLMSQGQLDQNNRQFNAGQIQQNNQFNAQGRLNAQNMQQENLRLGAQLNANLLGQGMGAEQLYQDRALGATLQRMGLETQYNPTMMAMGFDPYGGRNAGSQAYGPAMNLAGVTAGIQSDERMFNADANNWGNMARWSMNNMPNMQSGGSAWGGLAGAGLGAGIGVLGAALAPATFGTSMLGAGLIGAGVGGSVGASAGGLFR